MPGRNHARQAAIAALAVATCAVATTADVTIADYYDFDEWAADQDPEFRRYFYDVLLPGLKAEGRTLIVVTHDDRYFHVADQVVFMEEGRVVRVEERA